MKPIQRTNIPGWRHEVRPKEAAAIIGCSVGFVYALMKDGQIESRALLRRGYQRGIRLIDVASIKRFLAQENGTQPGTSENGERPASQTGRSKSKSLTQGDQIDEKHGTTATGSAW